MKLRLLASAALAVCVATPAAARDGSAYFGIEVGPMWAKDSKLRFNVGQSVQGFDIQHKLGVDGDLIAGYDFGLVRAEVEGAYKWAKHGKYVPVSGGTSPAAEGHSRVYSLMGNALIDLGKNETVNFYAGGGVGIAWVRETIEVSGGGGSSPQNQSGFAWQLIAGARAPVFRHFDVGVKYRYFDGPNIRENVGGSTAPIIAHSDFKSHSVLASLVYNFGEVAPPPPPPPPAPPPPPPPPPPATQTCPDGSVILATDACPAPPPPPPPPEPAPERGF